jgi:chromosome segregation ATPase
MALFQRTLPQLQTQRRDLRRRDEELRAQIAELEREVAAAPDRLTTQVEQQILAVHSRAVAERSLFDTHSSLADKRFLDSQPDERPMRRMRMHINAERRAFVIRCVALLAVLVVLLVWLRAAIG